MHCICPLMTQSGHRVLVNIPLTAPHHVAVRRAGWQGAATADQWRADVAASWCLRAVLHQGSPGMTEKRWPVCRTICADCGVGTGTIGDWYMVRDEVWKQTWAGRRKPWHKVPGQQILCITCLERRLGRVLVRADFTDAPINNPENTLLSDRLRNRLQTDITGGPSLRVRSRASAT